MGINEYKEKYNKLNSKILLLDKNMIKDFIDDNLFKYDFAFIKINILYEMFVQAIEIKYDKKRFYQIVEDLNFQKGQKYGKGQVFFGISNIPCIDYDMFQDKIFNYIKKNMYLYDKGRILIDDMNRIIHTFINPVLSKKQINKILLNLGMTKKQTSQGYCYAGVSIIPELYVEGISHPLQTISEIKEYNPKEYDKIIKNSPLFKENVTGWA